jgi:hypothetical protein
MVGVMVGWGEGVGETQMVGGGVEVGSRPLSGVPDGVGCCGSSDAVATRDVWASANRRAIMSAIMGKVNRKLLEGVEVFIFSPSKELPSEVLIK